MNVDAYCRWLSRFFYVHDLGAEDVFQECRLAAWRAQPGLERTAARRRAIDLLRAAQRRPRFAELAEETTDNVHDVVIAREQLRAAFATANTANERAALARVMRGEVIRRNEKALQVALIRLRQKLAA